MAICLSDRLHSGAAVIAERAPDGERLTVLDGATWERWDHSSPRANERRQEELRGFLSRYHLDGAAVRQVVAHEPRGGVRFGSAVDLGARARALGFLDCVLIGTGLPLHQVQAVWFRPAPAVWALVAAPEGERWRLSTAGTLREACAVADACIRMLARTGQRIE